jgi:tetratricopeptide (TPR) repeat protein
LALPAGFFAEIAEALGRQRQYAAAARFAAEGVALAPDDPEVLTALGTNELRLGRIESGRARLTQAFARDPYHVWNKNTLDLLDELANYRTVETPRFRLVGAPEEIDLLALHLGPLLETAYDSLAARYRYRPPTPVRIELYHRHADFSVRTVGLAGLGALGVSFGSVLAMDAPSARAVGDFNWGSTAWHELTHAFTLGMTDHQVPRWLSEGLSVLEERRARSGWGAQATPLFLAALKGNQLNPVSGLNEGFVRPRRAHDVILAYYQASLLCEYLESTFGFESVLKLLGAFRAGAATPAAFQSGTGLSMAEIDRRFDVWLRARFAEPRKRVAALRDSTVGRGELEMMMESGKRLKAAHQIDEAIAAFERADQMFPDMADPEGPAWYLAELHRERGHLPKAIEYLARVTRLNDSHYRANRLEAELRAQQGDDRGALAALDRAVWISPYDVGMNQEAAGLATKVGASAEAVRFRRAVVALHPSDQAGAWYELALAYRSAGDREAARREVLRALEEAPSFEKAQTLLLELRGRRP